MLHLRLIILSVRGDVLVDSKSLLVTDFVNLKIKSVQSFKSIYRSECSYMYKYLCLYYVS
jgi:hypothetical protein